MFEEIKKEVERVGYEIIAIKQSSFSHFYVVAKRDDGEHATWIYDSNSKGLSNGNYFMNHLDNPYLKAMNDFITRGLNKFN